MAAVIFDVRRLISDSKAGNIVVYTGSTEALKGIFFGELVRQLANVQEEYGDIKMRYKPPGVIEIEGNKIYLELFDSPEREDAVSECYIYKYMISLSDKKECNDEQI